MLPQPHWHDVNACGVCNTQKLLLSNINETDITLCRNTGDRDSSHCAPVGGHCNPVCVKLKRPFDDRASPWCRWSLDLAHSLQMMAHHSSSLDWVQQHSFSQPYRLASYSRHVVCIKTRVTHTRFGKRSPCDRFFRIYDQHASCDTKDEHKVTANATCEPRSLTKKFELPRQGPTAPPRSPR